MHYITKRKGLLVVWLYAIRSEDNLVWSIGQAKFIKLSGTENCNREQPGETRRLRVPWYLIWEVKEKDCSTHILRLRLIIFSHDNIIIAFQIYQDPNNGLNVLIGFENLEFYWPLQLLISKNWLLFINHSFHPVNLWSIQITEVEQKIKGIEMLGWKKKGKWIQLYFFTIRILFSKVFQSWQNYLSSIKSTQYGLSSLACRHLPIILI